MTANGLALTALLDLADPNAERWTCMAVLPDGVQAVAAAGHRLCWQDWLQWANLLQFLRSPGRDALISATSRAGIHGWEDLWIAALASSPGADEPTPQAAREPLVSGPTAAEVAGIDGRAWPVVDLAPAMMEELELVEDDAVRELVLQVLRWGAASFVAGHETDHGEPLEAAWPDQRVAIIAETQLLTAVEGWDIRPASEWSAAELRQLIEANS